jgi:hypothetical protein
MGSQKTPVVIQRDFGQSPKPKRMGVKEEEERWDPVAVS